MANIEQITKAKIKMILHLLILKMSLFLHPVDFEKKKKRKLNCVKMKMIF